MEDPALDELRKQRLAEMQAQYNAAPDNANAQQKAKLEQAQARQQAKMSVLAQILDQPARARLNTIKLTRPEKGQMVEDMLFNMASTGQLRTKIGETELINMLESLNSQMEKNKPTVKFDRRRAALDSDDDDF